MLAQVSMVVFTTSLLGRPPIMQYPALLTKQDTACRTETHHIERYDFPAGMRFSDRKTLKVTCSAGRTRDRHDITFMSRGHEAFPYLWVLPRMPIPTAIRPTMYDVRSYCRGGTGHWNGTWIQDLDPLSSYLIVCTRIIRIFVRGKEKDFNSERVKDRIIHPHNSKEIGF
jgi:hypothetical protein